MKIDDVYQNTNIIQKHNESAVNGKAKDQQSSIQSQDMKEEKKSGTEVDLSKTSVEFNKVTKEMETIPVERTEKINEIRARINNGTYGVDSSKVAEKIIKNSLNSIIES